MLHLRKILQSSLLVLSAFVLCCCATPPTQSDPIVKWAADWQNDYQSFNQRVREYNDRRQVLDQEKSDLMGRMSTEQLAAYAAVEKSTANTAESRLCIRRFWAALDHNPALAEDFRNYLRAAVALDEESDSLLEEQNKLERRRETIRTFAGAYYSIRQQQQAEWAQRQQALVQQGNWDRLHNDIQTLGVTIQNQGQSGRTVVVPRY